MSNHAIVPYFGYVEAHAAMDFLERAFGFAKIAAYDDDQGALLHGEMKLGSGFIMLGSISASDKNSSRNADAAGTYCVVDDVDAHFETAKSEGAAIVYPPEDTTFGTRRYRCEDPEGYEWSFGTYSPGSSRSAR